MLPLVGAALNVGGALISSHGVSAQEDAQAAVARGFELSNERYFQRMQDITGEAASKFRDFGRQFGEAFQANIDSRLSIARVNAAKKAVADRESTINKAVTEAQAQANVEGGAAGGKLTSEQQKVAGGQAAQDSAVTQAQIGAAGQRAGQTARTGFDATQAAGLSQALAGLGFEAGRAGQDSALGQAELNVARQKELADLNRRMQEAQDAGSEAVLGGQVLSSIGSAMMGGGGGGLGMALGGMAGGGA